MPQKMAVTHADLEPRRSRAELSSKTGAFFMILTILLGFICFVLCLVAEATRSEATWRGDKKGGTSECVYSGSGKVPLLCAACAFVGLAIAMVMEHAFLLIAVSNSSPSLVAWDPHSASAKSLTRQAGFFFIATWTFFAVGETLLLAGVSVESGHLKNWSKPKGSCLILKQGLFAAAGVFGLATVFLAAGLYLTALRTQRMFQEQENGRTEVLEASALYASPPTSPQRHNLTAIARENPIARQNENEHLLFVFPTPYNKSSRIL